MNDELSQTCWECRRDPCQCAVKEAVVVAGIGALTTPAVIAAANPPGDQRQEGEWPCMTFDGHRVQCEPAIRQQVECALLEWGMRERAKHEAASPPPEAAAAVDPETVKPAELKLVDVWQYHRDRAVGGGLTDEARTRHSHMARVLHIALAAPTGPQPAGGGVDIVRIPNPDRLDPITVYIEDEGGGRGRMTIVCYGEAWTCYWGAMGNRSLREFVAICDAQYVAGNMLSGRKHTTHEGKYAERIAAAVIAAIKGDSHAG